MLITRKELKVLGTSSHILIMRYLASAGVHMQQRPQRLVFFSGEYVPGGAAAAWNPHRWWTDRPTAQCRWGGGGWGGLRRQSRYDAVNEKTWNPWDDLLKLTCRTCWRNVDILECIKWKGDKHCVFYQIWYISPVLFSSRGLNTVMRYNWQPPPLTKAWISAFISKPQRIIEACPNYDKLPKILAAGRAGKLQKRF